MFVFSPRGLCLRGHRRRGYDAGPIRQSVGRKVASDSNMLECCDPDTPDVKRAKTVVHRRVWWYRLGIPYDFPHN